MKSLVFKGKYILGHQFICLDHLVRCLAGFMLLIACSVGAIAQNLDIYEYQTLVPNQNRPERNQATADGLAEVFLRASGQVRTLENGAVRSALSNASSYLVEYRYESTDKTLTIDQREVPAWQLILRFSGSAIEKLLRNERLSIWPANRPLLAAWVVVDDGRRRVITADEEPDMAANVTSAANRRGLPIALPKMDLEDQVVVSLKDVWNLQEDRLRKASERYRTESLIAGRIAQTSREWRATWLVMNQGKVYEYDSRGATLSDAVYAGIDSAADYFFSLYGYEPTGDTGHLLAFKVVGVSDFSSYTKILNYLSNLAAVSGVNLTTVQGNDLWLSLETEVDANTLRSALALDQQLIPVETSVPITGGSLTNNTLTNESLAEPGSQQNPLQYRWRQ